jgi:Selenocysteine synthase [seryl-tRNASer selenium transferase]
MGIYEELGVRPAINAWGTITKIGGSTMAPEVVAAMCEAARNYVDIAAFHTAAGARIAKLLGAEACCVTSGAAAGIAVSAAACMARTDVAKRLQLPDTRGMPNEAIILKCHRTLYDQAISLSGAKVVEVGTASFACPEQVEAALSERTAFFFYAAESETMRGSIDLATLTPMMKERGIPTVVDAAAEIPPKENVLKYLKKGADLVIFSGGKELRGPQSSGLILGCKDLIAACDANCCPNHSIGRPMKVDKESIAGIVKAVELFAAKDYAAQTLAWEDMVHRIVAALRDCPGVEAREGKPTEPGVQPADLLRAFVRPKRMGAADLQRRLIDGEPSVYSGLSGEEVVINPQCLEPNEVPAVIRAIAEATV